MNKTLSLVLSLTVVGGCAPSADKPVSIDDVVAGIDQQGIYAHLAFLSDDALEGRLTGEPGYDMAAAYVAEQFESFGLEVGGNDGWYQQVPLQTYHIDTDSPTLIARRDDGDIVLRYRDDFVMSGDKVRAEASVTGEAIYLGYGVHAPEHGYSDYDGIDVDGKILLVFNGGPEALPGDERAYFSASRTKAAEAARRGAVGFVGLRSRRSEKEYPWERLKKAAGLKPGMTWVDADGNADNYFPEIQGAAYLSAPAAERLMAGAPISFNDARDAAEASLPASVALGFGITLARNTRHERIESPNVIGIVRGTDPALADEYIVYTAHLDHVGRGVEVDGDDIYNGMYDNAMGIAIMLESARAFAQSPPRRSIMFIALTGEERGLLGSDYFAHYPTVPVEALVANVNIDMPLFLFPLADVVAFGAEHSSLKAAAESAATAEGFVLTPDPVPEENLFRRSDQYSFVRKGVPAIYLDPGFTSKDPSIDGTAVTKEHRLKHYHRPSDDLARPIDWDSAIRFARANTRLGYAIAAEDARPYWNEGDFFGDKFGAMSVTGAAH